MRGKVYFVGAGPGAADLLTVRAARVLSSANVVLHDDLVSQEVLALASKRARLIAVGKRCGKHGVTQETINEMLVSLAGEHRRVVRLKSGDPSIFGRLGEEIDVLREAEIEFEVVPGVTAAVAAAASAGIALTDRRHASEVIFSTGSRAGGKRRDWPQTSHVDSTLVIYMPGPDYRKLMSELMASGVPFDSPCVVVSRAGSKRETVSYMNVGQLGQASPAAPAIVMVGEVAKQPTSANIGQMWGTACDFVQESVLPGKAG